MQTGSLVNLLMAQSGNPTPTVGMGATMLHWTDREAGTVVEVSPNGKRLVVQEDTATRTDKNGMSDCQSYSYEPNPNGSKTAYTLRRNGRWVMEGESMRTGRGLRLGTRDKHYDFSF